MPGPVSRTASLKEPFGGRRLDRDLALVGELDGVADEIEQHLRAAGARRRGRAAGSAAPRP